MPAPPLRTLLLQEDATPGGVFTITQQLSHALQHAGHEVQSCALRTCTQRQLYHAARSADLLIATHNFRPAYAAWLLGLCTRRPVLVWFHGPLQEVLAAAHAHPAKRRWLRWLYARLPHLVFVSQAAHDSYLRFMAGTPLVSRQRSSVGLRWPSNRIAALHRLPIRSVLAAQCALRCDPMAMRSLRHLSADATLSWRCARPRWRPRCWRRCTRAFAPPVPG